MKKEYILGINPCRHGLNYHDPDAILFEDGEIVFGIEEERINRIKGSKGIFPFESVEMCLKTVGIDYSDLSGIAIPYNPTKWRDRLCLEINNIIEKYINGYDETRIESFVEAIKKSDFAERYDFFFNENRVKSYIKEKLKTDANIKIQFYDHHLSHVASAYEFSGFDCAIGVVVDGIGEAETTTVWKIKNHNYKKIMTLQYPNSVGYFYAMITRYLGFIPWQHEGKTMALAAYGEYNKKIYDGLSSLVKITEFAYDCSQFISDCSTLYLMMDEIKAVERIEQITGIPRAEEGNAFKKEYMDVAWVAQDILERSVLQIINKAVEKSGISNVCVAGGLFMNCKMNMVIREQSKAKRFFVQPLAGDIGLALGAGRLLSKNIATKSFKNLYFGINYSEIEIKNVLKKSNLKFRRSQNVACETAKLISQGKIICWFQGRMEMGARALGGRSILADPRKAEMIDWINFKVKNRENWRPFACSVLEENFNEVFESTKNERNYYFMIEAFKVKTEWADRIPAVIHQADNTSRPQIVSEETNSVYYRLIKEFYRITECPLILNTSFNGKGQPIIMSPKDAITFFEENEVDVLSIGDYILEK